MPGHLKRKRPGGGPEPSTTTKTTIATAPKPAAPRRATRQSSIPPLPVPEDPEPRRRRRRQQRAGDDVNGTLTEILPPFLSPRGKENMLADIHSEPPVRAQPVSKPSTRMTRYSAGQGQEASTAAHPPRSDIHLAKPSAISSPVRTITITPSDTQQPPTTPSRFATSAGRGRSRMKLTPINPQSVSLGRNRPVIMATSVAQPSQNPALNPSRTPNSAARGTDSAARPDRNIDKIVLGDICFPAWYPSYYGKELLGGVPGNSTKSGKGTKSNGNLTTSLPYQESKDDANGTTAHGRRDRDHPPMLNRLYVCPRCFKYSKELVTWWEHVRWCEQQGYLPGNKIYTHPKGNRTVLVPSVSAPRQGRGKRGSVGQRMVQEVVQDEGEWSIWEVDGEDDVLFCQNLSLFGKLFLDNKSVFFDVTGFKYFLLVHTPPPAPAPTATDLTETPAPPSDINNNNSRSQIVGFFSKEKMSWDNNNLACILVFPPWQRKGLGSLLMGISYEISRREGVLGGPEKPISDLGKRGYKHFWAGEICRWLLSLTPPTATSPSEGGESKETVAVAVPSGGEAELVVDVEACSQATWIAPEDCLGVLREMGLAEEAGTGPPPVSRVARGGAAAAAAATTTTTAPVREDQIAAAAAAVAAAPGTNGGTGAGGATAEASLPAADTAPAVTDNVVRRVRISQAAVRAWVAANRISLERACDPDGFVEGYALTRKAVAAEEETV